MSSEVWQNVDILQTPEVLVDQWLHSFSVLYLPDKNLAWIVAMATFVGEEEAVLHNGWGEVRDMKDGWKYCKEVRMEASLDNNWYEYKC